MYSHTILALMAGAFASQTFAEPIEVQLPSNGTHQLSKRTPSDQSGNVKARLECYAGTQPVGDGMAPPYQGKPMFSMTNPDGTMADYTCTPPDPDNSQILDCVGTSPWLWGTFTVHVQGGIGDLCRFNLDYCGVHYATNVAQPRCGSLDAEASNNPFQEDDVLGCFLPGCPDGPCADTGMPACSVPPNITP